MLQSLAKTIHNPAGLQKELARYDLSGITSLTALSRIKKAYLSASEHLQSDQDLLDCKTGLYASMQKLSRLGIDLNDIDLWFINQYKKEIKAEYVYQALLRSAAKRGYHCLPVFEFILKDEKFCTYYAENGRIIIDYRDEGLPKDVTLDNLSDYKFFFLLLNIKKDGKLIHQEKIQLTPAQVLKHKLMSKTKDKGEKQKKWNYDKKAYEMVDKDTESVWQQWTPQMIKKTLVLQAFSIIKHVLPDLGELFEFDDLDGDSNMKMTEPSPEPEFQPEIIDINNPSPAVMAEVAKLTQEYTITPELQTYNRTRIVEGINACKDKPAFDMLLSREAATIISLGDEFKNQVTQNAFKTISAV